MFQSNSELSTLTLKDPLEKQDIQHRNPGEEYSSNDRGITAMIDDDDLEDDDDDIEDDDLDFDEDEIDAVGGHEEDAIPELAPTDADIVDDLDLDEDDDEDDDDL